MIETILLVFIAILPYYIIYKAIKGLIKYWHEQKRLAEGYPKVDKNIHYRK